MKNRALMITPMVPHPRAANAGAVVMHGTLDALRRKYEVTLATLVTRDSNEGELLEDLIRSGVDARHVIRRSFHGWEGFWRRAGMAIQTRTTDRPHRSVVFHEPAFQRLITTLLRSSRYDALQIEDNAMAGYDFPGRPPAVLTEHEVRSDEDVGAEVALMGNRSMQFLCNEQVRWREYQGNAYRKFDRVQVFTGRDRRLAADLAGVEMTDRIRCNAFGIELPPIRISAEEDRNSILFVGGFLHPPNVTAALWLGRELMPILRASAPAARLTIVGSNPPPEVRALAASDIIVTGYVPTLDPFLAAAAVSVAPLHAGGGMRRKVLEAMAWGIPVVATPIASEGIPVSDPPPLLTARGAAEFAQCIVSLLESADLRRQIGGAGRTLVASDFTWDAYARRLLALHAEIAAPSAAP
jgi:glycosyltransferase involved in cell wall biosynthesis